METLPDIAGKVIKDKESKISNWVRYRNYTSTAGHPCLRFLYYERVAWDKKEPYNVTMQFIFSGGLDIERQALREIEDAGFKVIRQQEPLQWEDYQLTGRVDGMIEVNGHLCPIEIKGYTHHAWTRLDTVQDFLRSDFVWHKTVPAQLMLYMIMADCQYGCIYLKSKNTFEPKCIWIELGDFDPYVMQVLNNLMAVNVAVRDNDPPNRCDMSLGICKGCGYFTLCQPDIELAKGAEILVDDQLEQALMEREDAKPHYKKYQEVDKYVKKRLKGCEKAVIGDFIVTGKWIGGTTNPDGTRSGANWRTSITKFGKTDNRTVSGE